jgi:CheY-like chemotaxis protein/signal transduction histidine kinase
MLEALPEPAMIIHLASQRIAAANSLAVASLGPSTTTLAGTDASRLRDDLDRDALASALHKLATDIDGACATIEETLLRSDPSGLLVRSEFRAFQVDGERYALHVFRERIAPSTTADRTRVQELEQELRALRETVELDARRKGEFYASLSRELRNPLTSILGYLDLIADPESPERERPVWLGQIRKSGESLMGLVQDLVDLGQMEAGTFKLESDSFSTSLALAHVLSQARARAQHQGRDVIARYTTPVPRMVTLDPVRFRQGLSTLIHFVIENTSKGDVTLQTAVIGDGDERRLAFDVSAFCRELDHADLDPLFDPFRPTTLRARPWSLAFPVARRLSEMMGGTIEWGLDADRVWLRLTIRPTQADFVHMAHLSLPDERETPPSTHPPVRLRGTVLLVEDSESDRLLVAKILERSGLQVDFVSCGAEALERPVQRYDAILMDVELPDMDGLETTRRLRAAGATVPIIALTASVLVGDRERCLDAGCTAYVTKPIDRRADQHHGRPPGHVRASAGDGAGRAVAFDTGRRPFGAANPAAVRHAHDTVRGPHGAVHPGPRPAEGDEDGPLAGSDGGKLWVRASGGGGQRPRGCVRDPARGHGCRRRPPREPRSGRQANPGGLPQLRTAEPLVPNAPEPVHHPRARSHGGAPSRSGTNLRTGVLSRSHPLSPFASRAP